MKCQLNLVEHYCEHKFPNNYLSEINENNFNKLINEFIDIFSKVKYDIGGFTIEYCEINLTNCGGPDSQSPLTALSVVTAPQLLGLNSD